MLLPPLPVRIERPRLGSCIGENRVDYSLEVNTQRRPLPLNGGTQPDGRTKTRVAFPRDRNLGSRRRDEGSKVSEGIDEDASTKQLIVKSVAINASPCQVAAMNQTALIISDENCLFDSFVPLTVHCLFRQMWITVLPESSWKFHRAPQNYYYLVSCYSFLVSFDSFKRSSHHSLCLDQSSKLYCQLCLSLKYQFVIYLQSQLLHQQRFLIEAFATGFKMNFKVSGQKKNSLAVHYLVLPRLQADEYGIFPWLSPAAVPLPAPLNPQLPS